MGSSGWDYFVPYQADIGKALQQLRQKVYDEGDYYKREVPNEYKDLTEEQIRNRYGGYEDSESLINDILYERSLPEPTDPDSLIDWNIEAGAHSIIDITSISDKPEFATASPLADVQLMELFGTTKPSHAQVEEQKFAIMDLRERWVGTYIIVYENDEPSEIFFAGHSGD